MQNAALAIILNKNNEILLVQRKDVPVWVLPGGGIEKHESPEQAVIREILEECSLHIRVHTHTATYMPINRLASTTYIFYCIPTSSTHVYPQPEELRSARFFPVHDLPKHLFFVHKNFIQDWETGSVFPLIRPLAQVTYIQCLRTFIAHPLWTLRYICTRLFKC